jgi:chitinase
MQRRNVLKSIAGAAGIAGASGLSSAADCSSTGDWDSGTTYTGGDMAVYDGTLYEASWWTRGDEPGSSQWGPWEEVGPCDGGGGGGDDDNDGGGGDTGNCSGINAWDSSATYTGGEQVVYSNNIYEASWWTRGDEPGSSEWGPWEMVEECSSGDGGDGDDGSDGGDGGDGGDSSLDAVIDAPARVGVGEEATLSAADSEGDIDSYEWYVGDQGPISGAENSLTLDEKGSYEVELTVMDADGNSDTATRTLFVGAKPDDDKNRVVAYYRQWAQYDRSYNPQDIPLDKVTHVQYAFARPEEDGSINLVGQSFGQQAFYDGATGQYQEFSPGPSFADLAEQNDDTKFTLSIGGWGDSEYFSYAAETEENRQRFADQCAEWVDRGNLDGIDIDWEFPHGGGCQGDGGAACNTPNVSRPDIDIPNFTKLCRTVRERLDEKAAEEGREEPYEVTAAVSADTEGVSDYEHEELSEILDFILVMTFDYAGIWSERTRHHSPLKENPNDPFEQSDTWNASYALSWYEQQGWDPDQLHMAVPFYGRSWSDINAPDGEGNGEDDGLFQTFEGEGSQASGEGTFGGIGGVYEYYDLAGGSRGGSAIIDSGDWETYIDEEAVTAWSYDSSGGGEMISHDTQETMQMKMEWLRDSPYGGTMLWAMGGDTKSDELITTLWDTLNG